jgi:formate dehydrogenase subunit gamma
VGGAAVALADDLIRGGLATAKELVMFRCPMRPNILCRFQASPPILEIVERIQRFTRSERAAHWLVAAAFAVMLFTGGQVPHHWTWSTPALDVHVGAAVVLVVGLVALLLVGDRTALGTTARQLRSLGRDDRAWLSPFRILTRRSGPAVGRFNGGQKMNAILATLGLAGLYASGIYLLTLGRSAFGHLHGPFAFLTTALIAGHIFMAVINPSTRHALRGMTLGSVDREWARHHHPRWVDEVETHADAVTEPGQ